jgi:hypothetical protein
MGGDARRENHDMSTLPVDLRGLTSASRDPAFLCVVAFSLLGLVLTLALLSASPDALAALAAN